MKTTNVLLITYKRDWQHYFRARLGARCQPASKRQPHAASAPFRIFFCFTPLSLPPPLRFRSPALACPAPAPRSTARACPCPAAPAAPSGCAACFLFFPACAASAPCPSAPATSCRGAFFFFLPAASPSPTSAAGLRLAGLARGSAAGPLAPVACWAAPFAREAPPVARKSLSAAGCAPAHLAPTDSPQLSHPCCVMPCTCTSDERVACLLWIASATILGAESSSHVKSHEVQRARQMCKPQKRHHSRSGSALLPNGAFYLQASREHSELLPLTVRTRYSHIQ